MLHAIFLGKKSCPLRRSGSSPSCPPHLTNTASTKSMLSPTTQLTMVKEYKVWRNLVWTVELYNQILYNLKYEKLWKKVEQTHRAKMINLNWPAWWTQRLQKYWLMWSGCVLFSECRRLIWEARIHCTAPKFHSIGLNLNKDAFFSANVSTCAKLEIKNMQACESVLRRYERKILKIVYFDLNIRKGAGRCNNITFLTPTSVLYLCSTSSFMVELNDSHGMSYGAVVTYMVAGNGGPGADRCSQQGLGERWPGFVLAARVRVKDEGGRGKEANCSPGTARFACLTPRGKVGWIDLM